MKSVRDMRVAASEQFKRDKERHGCVGLILVGITVLAILFGLYAGFIHYEVAAEGGYNNDSEITIEVWRRILEWQIDSSQGGRYEAQ